MTDTTMLSMVTRRADRLMDEGQHHAAARLLAQALADIDPVTAPTQPWLLNAAITYVHALSHQPDTIERRDTQLSWARYAYTATLRSKDTRNWLWGAAMDAYAEVLQEQGLTFDATQVYRRKVTGYRRYGPAEWAPAAWMTLCAALHADGQCDDARTEIREALHAWLRQPVDPPSRGRRLLATYASILAGCGHPDQAVAVLAQHADLLGPLGASERAAAAFWISLTIDNAEREDRSVCTAHRTNSAPQAVDVPTESQRRWHQILLTCTNRDQEAAGHARRDPHPSTKDHTQLGGGNRE